MTPAPSRESRGPLELAVDALQAIADAERTSIRRSSVTKPHVRDVAGDALEAIVAAQLDGAALELAPLITPGPARSAAVDRAAASLRRDVGLCGDRCRAAAANALDAALNAYQEPRA